MDDARYTLCLAAVFCRRFCHTRLDCWAVGFQRLSRKKKALLLHRCCELVLLSSASRTGLLSLTTLILTLTFSSIYLFYLFIFFFAPYPLYSIYSICYTGAVPCVATMDDLDFNMDTVNTLHRKDTTKGPPLRVLSLGMTLFLYTLFPGG